MPLSPTHCTFNNPHIYLLVLAALITFWFITPKVCKSNNTTQQSCIGSDPVNKKAAHLLSIHIQNNNKKTTTTRSRNGIVESYVCGLSCCETYVWKHSNIFRERKRPRPRQREREREREAEREGARKRERETERETERERFSPPCLPLSALSALERSWCLGIVSSQ